MIPINDNDFFIDFIISKEEETGEWYLFIKGFPGKMNATLFLESALYSSLEENSPNNFS